MRRFGGLLGCLVVLLVFGVGLGSAAGAGHRKLVEGTVYDTTCATVCEPECPPPPHCGPITADSRADVVCAQRIIVCPLEKATSASPYPVYSGEGAIVHVRRRGSAKVLAQLKVVEGHFKIRLGPGEYVLHPYLPEEQCWSGEPELVKVTAKTQGPIPASLQVSDSCAAHPGATM
ncbi:MAG: hypothetical protein QM729_02785 [Solirubrobacterales bacterium]